MLNDFLNFQLFGMGDNAFSVRRLLTVILVLVIFSVVVHKVHKIWLKRISPLELSQRGAIESFSRFIYYLVLMIGFTVVLHANGIDLTALTLLTSALGIGIGFGLQAITNNLISGIIILFERPIKVGDRIEVGPITGDVIQISIRASTILTNDNIAVIVPNSEFITQRVTNWSFNDRSVRSQIKVGVAYSSDVKLVTKVLLEVVEAHDGVLKTPAPTVLLESFEDSAIQFAIRVWTSDYSNRIGSLRSELNYLILEKFRENNIEIPFPQRDVHFKQSSISLASENQKQ